MFFYSNSSVQSEIYISKIFLKTKRIRFFNDIFIILFVSILDLSILCPNYIIDIYFLWFYLTKTDKKVKHISRKKRKKEKNLKHSNTYMSQILNIKWSIIYSHIEYETVYVQNRWILTGRI